MKNMKIIKNSSNYMTVDELNKFIRDMDIQGVEVKNIIEVVKPKLRMSDHQAIIYKCVAPGLLNLHIKYFPDNPRTSEIYFIFGDKLKAAADLYSGDEEGFEFLSDAIREYPLIEDKIYRRTVYISTKVSLLDAISTAERWYSKFKERG